MLLHFKQVRSQEASRLSLGLHPTLRRQALAYLHSQQLYQTPSASRRLGLAPLRLEPCLLKQHRISYSLREHTLRVRRAITVPSTELGQYKVRQGLQAQALLKIPRLYADTLSNRRKHKQGQIRYTMEYLHSRCRFEVNLRQANISSSVRI